MRLKKSFRHVDVYECENARAVPILIAHHANSTLEINATNLQTAHL